MNEAVKPAYKRLFDVQAHWHKADENYFNPNEFRVAINSCIQELRNVTFVLQNNKRNIPNFESWYEPWQEKMRANKYLKWLVSSRNYIVKQGDLELHSVLRIEVIGSYIDGEIKIFERLFDPKLTNDEIYLATIECGLPKEVLENSYVKLERRWIDKKYPDYELLDMLGMCWAAVEELLSDVPDLDGKNKDIKEEHSHLPPCMHKGSEDHSIWMKVVGDSLVPSELHIESVSPTKEDIDKAKNRYGSSPIREEKIELSDFQGVCNVFLKQAMHVLKKDGHHVHLAALFSNEKSVSFVELRNDDQADKFRTAKYLGSEVDKIGADKVIVISETWSAPYDSANHYRPASQSPDRTEALSLIAISKNGEGHTVLVPFTRNDGEIEFGDIQRTEGVEGVNFIQPIVNSWKQQ